MNAQEKQLIDLLFSKLKETAVKSGPRDRKAESHIKKRMKKISGARYYMAQAIIVQQQALKQAAAKIAQLEQQGDSSQATNSPQRNKANRSTSQPQGGGFLAGAAQTAVGIGGGILLANAGMALFDDIEYGDAFDAADSYDEGFMDATEDVVDDLDFGGGMDDLGFDDW